MTPDEEIAAVLELYGERAKVTTPRGFGEPCLTVRPVPTNPNILLEIQLHGTYPSDLPTLSFEGLSNADASTLYSRLEEVGKALSNQSMLLDIVACAIEWLENEQTSHEGSPEPTDHHFISNASEELSEIPEAAATPSSSHSMEKMRTAKDVIGRIRWDDQLDGTEFTVSYLDRFRGELEESFLSIDWDNAPFPHHRIQSFKFKGTTVWDKRIPLDNVFGSRGSGKKIEEVLEEELDAEGTTSRRCYCLSIPVKGATHLKESIRKLEIHLDEQILNTEDPEDHQKDSFNLVLYKFVVDDDAKSAERVKEVLLKFRFLFVALVAQDSEIELSSIRVVEQGTLCVTAIMPEGMDLFLSRMCEALSAIKVQVTSCPVLCQTPHNPLTFKVEEHPEVPDVADHVETYLGKVSVRKLEIQGPALGVETVLKNGLASLHDCLPSLIISNKLEPMSRQGHLFSEDAADLSETLERDPSSVSDLELRQLLELPLRSHMQNMDVTVGTVVVLSGAQQWRTCVIQSLQEALTGTVVLSFSEDASASILGHCEAMLQNLGSLINAMEQDEKCIVLDNLAPHLGEHHLICRCASLAGYRLRIYVCAEEGSNANDLSQPWSQSNGHWDMTVIPVTASNPSPEALVQELITEDCLAQDDRNSSAAGEWNELCAFLTARARVDLVRRVPPIHPEIHAGHVTLTKKPTRLQLQECLPLGSTVQFTATEVQANTRVQICCVQLAGNRNRLPHIDRALPIVISSQVPLDQIDGSDMAQLPASRHPMEPLHLSGILGVRMTYPSQRSDRQIIWPGLLQEEEYPMEDAFTSADVEVAAPGTEVTELNVFDFDGTLMCTPDEFVGRQEYEELKGEPYPYLGWYGRAESLSPPVRVLPGPAMQDCHSFSGCEGSWTVVLTGRLFKLKQVVKNVLKRYSVTYDELICKRSSQDTQDFKISTVMSLLQRFKQVHKIRIWEDNVENLVAFYRLRESLRDAVDVEVIEAPTMPPPMGRRGVAFNWQDRGCLWGMDSFLDAMGRLQDKKFFVHAEAGLEMIAVAWRAVLKLSIPLQRLFFLTGPYAFGRLRCNIELHLLEPTDLEHEKALNQLSEILKQQNPHLAVLDGRLMIQIHFRGSCPITFEVSFIRVEREMISSSSTVRDLLLHVLEPAEVRHVRIIQDLKSQRRFEQCFAKRPGSRNVFRVALEMLEQIACSNELNAENESGFRTAHFAHLIAMHSECQSTDCLSNADQFCMSWIIWIAELTVEELLLFCKDSDITSLSSRTGAEVAERLIHLMKRLRCIFKGSDMVLHWTQAFDLLLTNHNC